MLLCGIEVKVKKKSILISNDTFFFCSIVVMGGRRREVQACEGDKVLANGRKSLKFAATTFHVGTEGPPPPATDPGFDPLSRTPSRSASVSPSDNEGSAADAAA